ncbi:hypothetical protein [Kitasatospora fiedleri]|uniref:hypothetical protein n=1 Tax=Kitasatospora fiedleri TaxID=2991545 RepID=UPI00249A65D5|nr:hypothetical protein [Kitasatospora fiedleri]
MAAAPRLQQPRPAALDVRLVRAAAFATAGAVLGSAGHAAGCGGLAWRPLAAGWLFVFSASVVVAARRRGPLAATLAAALGQVLFHLLFRLAETPPAQAVGSVPARAAVAHAGHGAGGFAPASGMLAAHLAAAVAVGLLLHRVESALGGLVGLARRMRDTARRRVARVAVLLRTLLRAPSRPAVAVPRPVRRSAGPLGRLLIDEVVVRRGPPRAGTARRA